MTCAGAEHIWANCFVKIITARRRSGHPVATPRTKASIFGNAVTLAMVRALESAAPLVLEFVGVVGVVGVVVVSVGISPGLDLVRSVLLSTALSEDALARLSAVLPASRWLSTPLQSAFDDAPCVPVWQLLEH